MIGLCKLKCSANQRPYGLYGNCPHIGIIGLTEDADVSATTRPTAVAGLFYPADAALLDLRNSGDSAGDKSRVVGYAAFTFYEDESHER